MKEYIVRLNGNMRDRLWFCAAFLKQRDELRDVRVFMESGSYPRHEEYAEFSEAERSLPQGFLRLYREYKRFRYEHVTCCGSFSDIADRSDVVLCVHRDDPEIRMLFCRDYQNSDFGNDDFLNLMIDTFHQYSNANVFFYQSRVL